MPAGAIKAGRAFVLIEAIDNTSRVLRKVSGNMHAYAAQVTSIGQRLVTQAALLAAPIAFATRTFTAFDDQMRKVAAVSGASESQFRALTHQAKELGRTTSFTAAQVAELQTELGKAGFSPDQILQQTPSILDLSRATDTDTATAAGIAASALRQFNLEATETQRIADGLTATANGTFNTLESIGEALKYAGPVFEQFNISFEESLALVGALGNIGIQGSMAGTTLKNLELRAASMPQQFEKIGVSTMDAAGNLRNLLDILEDLDQATKSMGTGQRAEILNRLMGVRSITGGAKLSGDTGSVKALLAMIEGSTGRASRTSQEMDAGIGGAFRRLMSAIEGVQIATGEALNPLSTLVDVFAAGLPAVADWISAHSHLVSMLVAGLGAVAATGVAFLTLGLSIKVLALAIVPVSTALALLKGLLVGIPAILGLMASPAGMFVAALAAIATAVVVLGDGWSEAWNGISSTFVTAWQTIIAKIGSGDLVGAGQVALAGLRSVWAETLGGMSQIWISFRSTIAASWISLLDQIQQVAIQAQTAVADSILRIASTDTVAGAFTRRVVLGMNAEESQRFVGQGDAAIAENHQLAAQRQADRSSATDEWLTTLFEDVAREKAAARKATEEAQQALTAAIEAVPEAGAALTVEALKVAGQVQALAASPLSLALPRVAAGIPEALERGSAAAARTALENQQRQQMGDLIAATNHNGDQLGEIHDLLEQFVNEVQGI